MPPELCLRAAAGRADLRRLHTEFGEAAQAVVHAERDALERGAAIVARGERAGVDAEHRAAAVRDVGRALAFEVGQQQEAARTGGDFRGLRLELLVRVAEVFPHHLGGDGDVHRAEQREPVVRAVAKGGDFPGGIHDRLVRTGVDGATGPEARGDDAGAGVPQEC